MTTAVLVHGGWHSASCWDLVRAELTADGIRSVAPQLPMTSTLDVDAAVVRETLDQPRRRCRGRRALVGRQPGHAGRVGCAERPAPDLPGRLHDRSGQACAGRLPYVAADARLRPGAGGLRGCPRVRLRRLLPRRGPAGRRGVHGAAAAVRPRGLGHRRDLGPPGLEPLPDDLRRHRAGPRRQPRRSAGHGSEGRRRRGAGHEPLAVPLPASAESPTSSPSASSCIPPNHWAQRRES